MRYFKKTSPTTKLYLTNGSPVQFERVNSGVGIFATENPTILQEFERMIAAHRGGLDEIGSSEYDELKKNKDSGRAWREEWSPAQIGGKVLAQQPASNGAGAVPAAATGSPVPLPVPAGAAVPRPTATRR